MRFAAKLTVITVFCLVALAVACSRSGSAVTTSIAPKTIDTPPAATAPAAAGDKKIEKTFVLAQDSQDEKYGEVEFDHETHASKNYSPDGKSQIACIECHHTDQPKSALKPPLSTSERDVTLTMDVWKSSSQKVSKCRDCHFQPGSIPEGKTMPTATYTEGGASKTKNLDNQLAYHNNCNTCHDQAFKLRPEEVRKNAKFATSDKKDCGICHKPIS